MRWMIVAILIGLSSYPVGASQHRETSTVKTTKTSLPQKRLDVPVYKPPLLGSPRGRVAGGTRGANPNEPVLSALAPNHTGFSTHARPTLYWYLSKTSAHPIEITLTDQQSVKPLLTWHLSPNQPQGIQQIALANHRITLKSGVEYNWSVRLITDPNRPSKDVVTGGSIVLTPLSRGLRAYLKQVGPTRAPFVYAQAGLWYDAVMALSSMIDAAPQNHALRQQRAALLKQVGLAHVASADLRDGDGVGAASLKPNTN